MGFTLFPTGLFAYSIHPFPAYFIPMFSQIPKHHTCMTGTAHLSPRAPTIPCPSAMINTPVPHVHSHTPLIPRLQTACTTEPLPSARKLEARPRKIRGWKPVEGSNHSKGLKTHSRTHNHRLFFVVRATSGRCQDNQHITTRSGLAPTGAAQGSNVAGELGAPL